MNYTQIPPVDRDEMLRTIGVSSIDDLFAVIPGPARFKGRLNIPDGVSELELQRELAEMASRTNGAHNALCFLGAGAYDHFIPAFIDQMISRGEFLTAYTPYQAEASQGSLQAFFEFQTQIARLAGLDIANASMYEGATAIAEGVLLGLNHTGKRRVVVSAGVHPHTRAVIRTYLGDLAAEYVEAPISAAGVTSVDALRAALDDDTACVVVQSPNVFGLIEDWSALFGATRGSTSKGKAPVCVAAFNPVSLGLLRSPGACGADVAAGEGQPLGIPLQLGGPYLGLFAARSEFTRRMPGRLVGRTTDAAGRDAYCLTLQTREQHIRGAKATSNICTNQGLMALRATMYMTAMGRDGLREVAAQCWHKAHALAERIAAQPGFGLAHPDSAFFNEFVVRCPIDAETIVERALSRGFLVGVPLGSERMHAIGAPNELLVAVTEKRTAAELDALVACLKGCAS